MASLAVKVTLRGGKDLFREALEQARNPVGGRARERMAQAMRDSAVRDFRDQGHHGPGGFTRWADTHDFGDCPPAPKILGGNQGGLAQAWRTATLLPTLKSVIVQASHPGMRAHAFGALVKVTDRMRAFLHAVCAVHLKAITRFLVIPQRRFADFNPALNKRLEEIAAEAFLA